MGLQQGTMPVMTVDDAEHDADLERGRCRTRSVISREIFIAMVLLFDLARRASSTDPSPLPPPFRARSGQRAAVFVQSSICFATAALCAR